MRNSKLTRLVAMLLALMMAFALTACGSKEETATEEKTETSTSTDNKTEDKKEEEKPAEPTYKTELNIAINANPPTLDVHLVNSNIIGGIAYHTNEPLFALDGNYEVQPVLAKGYEVSEDGLVYTITLREGVKFHNGQEMKADDVVASMTRWLSLSGKAKALLDGTTFAKVDDYTITMTLPKAYADAMTVVATSIQWAAIYPQSSIESAGDAGLTEFIGTGPYKMEEWKQDQYVLLTKNADYVQPEGESSGFAGKKEAYAEKIYYRIVTDETTRIAGVQTGEYDVSEGISLEQYETLAADKNVALSVKTSGTLNMFFNTTKRALANPDLRQAVLAAINCDDVMLAAYGDPNLYILNPGWCNPDDAAWGTDAGKDYYNQNNIEKAKELLAKAGYNNEEIVLVTTPDYPEMYNATLVVQQQLIAAGMNAVVEQYDFATFMEHRANTEQYDLFITSNRYNLSPVQLSVLTKDWAGLDLPEIDASMVAIRTAASQAEASAEWANLQEFLYEHGASLVFGHYSGLIASGAEVEGFNYFDLPIYWNVKVPE